MNLLERLRATYKTLSPNPDPQPEQTELRKLNKRKERTLHLQSENRQPISSQWENLKKGKTNQHFLPTQPDSSWVCVRCGLTFFRNAHCACGQSWMRLGLDCLAIENVCRVCVMLPTGCSRLESYGVLRPRAGGFTKVIVQGVIGLTNDDVRFEKDRGLLSTASVDMFKEDE